MTGPCATQRSLGEDGAMTMSAGPGSGGAAADGGTGTPDDRREDVYVTRDSAPAIPVELDLIAAARTYLRVLVAEVRRLRDS